MDSYEIDGRLSNRSGGPVRPHMYQRFNLVSCGSHDLGVFDLAFFLKGLYGALDGEDHQRSDTDVLVSHVSFDW